MPKPTAKQQIEAMRALGSGAAAWLLGVSPRTLRDRPELPRNEDGSYCAADLFAWGRRQTAPVGDDDPLLKDQDSPAAERYRAAKAILAEMDVAQRRRELVPYDEFEGWYLEAIATPLLRLADRLKTLHGAAAGELVTRVLEELDQVIEERGPGHGD